MPRLAATSCAALLVACAPAAAVDTAPPPSTDAPASASTPAPAPTPTPGPLASVEMRDVNPGSPTFGTTVAVRELLARGERVVVSFYASWCKPCFDELGVLEAAHRTDGVTVLMLGLDGERVFALADPSAQILEHRERAEASALPFLVFDDAERAYALYLELGYQIDEPRPMQDLIAERGAIFSVPLTLTLDGDGNVAAITSETLDDRWRQGVIALGQP
ncbi:MAG: redoxin domain-containing protein [Myxococcota bacterium]